MIRSRRPLCALILLSSLFSYPAGAQSISITDVEPSNSETDQNSEPSLAINPANTNQILVTAFSDTTSPVYYSGDGGSTWTNVQQIDSSDSTMDWADGGNAYFGNITADGQRLEVWNWNASSGSFQLIQGSLLTRGGGGPDQPRLAANHVGAQDHIYVGYNDLSQPTKTASVYYSLDSGATWKDQVIENVSPGADQDGYSIRPAVSGSTVYLCFERWNTLLSNGNFIGDLVVVKDTNNGAHSFTDLGVDGAIVASRVQFPEENIGHERAGSDLGMAVAPANPSKVYIGYCAQVNNLAVVNVAMSADGGSTWSQIYQTSVHSALPDLSVTSNGAVGLLYTAYVNGNLETHFVQSDDDFATHRDEILSRFKDGTPKLQYQPYIGDFEIIKAAGNAFYGTFSASNNTVLYPFPVKFVRDAGELGTTVPFSIDPFYFTTPALSGSYSNQSPVTPGQTFQFSGHGSLTFNVLTAVTDANGDSLTLIGASQGKHGKVSISPNGKIIYVSGATFGGMDTFQYTVSDGNGGVSSGTVTIQTPFNAVKGIYNGLVLDNPQTNGGTGFFQTTVTYTGSVTGKIILGGTAYSFRGALDNAGTAMAQATDSRGDRTNLSLDLPLASGSVVTGTAINGAVSSSFMAQVDPYNAANPAPERGVRCNVAIPHNPGDMGMPYPQGDGYGAVSVSAAGLVRISGVLGDGSVFSQSAYLSGSGGWPIYVSLDQHRGAIYGNALFTGTSVALSGTLNWVTPAFTMQVDLAGSSYKYVKGHPIVFEDNGGAGMVTLARPGAPSITHHIVVSAANAVTVTDPAADRLKLALSPATGTVSGSFLDSVTSKTVPIHGLILQPDAGDGLFIQNGQSGSMELQK
jgi:hypothetical protein